MELVIKIYDSLSDTTPKVTLEDFVSLEIQEDLANFSTAKLVVDMVDGIEDDDFIKIYEIGDFSDELLFEGVIQLQPSVYQLTMNIRDYKALFQRKGLTTDKTYTTQTPKQIIDDMIAYYNGQGDAWTCVSGVSTTLTKEYATGDRFFDIIDEMAQELSCQWIIRGTTIYFETLVGEDYTSGVNFTEVVYNGEDTNENNITDIQIENYSKIQNVLIGQDKDGNKVLKTDATSITANGPLFGKVDVRNGDLNTTTQSFLDIYKVQNRFYNLEIEPFTLNVNIGDKIAVRIEEVNSYLDFEGDAFVVRKNTKIENATKIITYGVSTINLKLDDFINRMRGIDNNLKYLSL